MQYTGRVCVLNSLCDDSFTFVRLNSQYDSADWYFKTPASIYAGVLGLAPSQFSTFSMHLGGSSDSFIDFCDTVDS